MAAGDKRVAIRDIERIIFTGSGEPGINVRCIIRLVQGYMRERIMRARPLEPKGAACPL
jgi:hypothetical protein